MCPDHEEFSDKQNDTIASYPPPSPPFRPSQKSTLNNLIKWIQICLSNEISLKWLVKVYARQATVLEQRRRIESWCIPQMPRDWVFALYGLNGRNRAMNQHQLIEYCSYGLCCSAYNDSNFIFKRNDGYNRGQVMPDLVGISLDRRL